MPTKHLQLGAPACCRLGPHGCYLRRHVGMLSGYTPVAQFSNLLYRRLPVGSVLARWRACGLEIRDTAGWKPALRTRHEPAKCRRSA